MYLGVCVCMCMCVCVRESQQEYERVSHTSMRVHLCTLVHGRVCVYIHTDVVLLYKSRAIVKCVVCVCVYVCVYAYIPMLCCYTNRER